MSGDLFGRVEEVRAKQRRRARPAAAGDVAARAAHDDTADPEEPLEAPPPAPPIPEHLRKYLVNVPRQPGATSATTWRDDYNHAELDGDGKPKYPDGVCSRPDCRPCRVKGLAGDAGQTWAGLARMAAARAAAGVGLDELDHEALNRAAAVPIQEA